MTRPLAVIAGEGVLILAAVEVVGRDSIVGAQHRQAPRHDLVGGSVQIPRLVDHHVRGTLTSAFSLSMPAGITISILSRRIGGLNKHDAAN